MTITDEPNDPRRARCEDASQDDGGSAGAAQHTSAWVRAIALADLVPGRGVAVLGPQDTQVALFRIADDELYAVGNVDPFARAAVISRGLVGERAGVPTVASPLLKQVFSLRTGVCLDDESVTLGAFGTRVVDGCVDVCVR